MCAVLYLILVLQTVFVLILVFVEFVHKNVIVCGNILLAAAAVIPGMTNYRIGPHRTMPVICKTVFTTSKKLELASGRTSHPY